MKNKRNSYKNRVKYYYTEEKDNNRIKEDEGNPSIQEINDMWKKDTQDLKNPEQDGDLS